jgi:hypothetical protein
MSQCEKTENQAEQNYSRTVARIEAHPTPLELLAQYVPPRICPTVAMPSRPERRTFTFGKFLKGVPLLATAARCCGFIIRTSTSPRMSPRRCSAPQPRSRLGTSEEYSSATIVCCYKRTENHVPCK